MIAYYFRNTDIFTLKTSPLSKLLDEHGNVELINEYITELTEEHKTPVLACLQGGKV